MGLCQRELRIEYHLIMPSRGYDVIEMFMRDCEAEVWVRDCWKPQLNAPDLYGAPDPQLARID